VRCPCSCWLQASAAGEQLQGAAKDKIGRNSSGRSALAMAFTASKELSGKLQIGQIGFLLLLWQQSAPQSQLAAAEVNWHRILCGTTPCKYHKHLC